LRIVIMRRSMVGVTLPLRVDEWLTAVSRQGHPVPRRLPASSPMLGNTGRLQHTVGSVDEWLTDAGQSGQPPG
jgi:hypothetical protein